MAPTPGFVGYPPNCSSAKWGPPQRGNDMTLERKVELLHRSSDRLMKALDLARDQVWWGFIHREVWVHLKWTLELLWVVLRRKE